MRPNQWLVARREMRWHESKILVSIEPSAMTYGMAESSLRRFAGARVAAGGPTTCVAMFTVATAVTAGSRRRFGVVAAVAAPMEGEPWLAACLAGLEGDATARGIEHPVLVVVAKQTQCLRFDLERIALCAHALEAAEHKVDALRSCQVCVAWNRGDGSARVGCAVRAGHL